MGLVSGYLVTVLSAAYAVVLAIGLVTLPTSHDPIQNPWFTMMEVLILLLSPAMVVFAVALHAWVSPVRQPAALLGIIFMGLCAVVTCSVHFSVLTLSRQPIFMAADWAPLVLGFTWPSIAYALDILAWDGFFPLSAALMALALQGKIQAKIAQRFFIGSAVLAWVGLVGVPGGNMAIRNIGIIGYVLLFPMGTALLANRCRRGEL